MPSVFLSFFLLTSLFLSTVSGGGSAALIARSPVVLGGQEACAEQRWACYAPSSDAPVGAEARREAVVSGARPLRVVSYNVHKCTGMDFKRDPGRIAAVIRSLDADIVALQEVLSEPGGVPAAQVRLIAEKTGMYMAVAGPTKRKKDGAYGNALLSRFPITEVRLHDISHGASEPRGVIDADISVGGLVVRVVATHLGLGPAERTSQVERLLSLLPAEPRSPLIVMGDMNGWVPGSPALRRLRERLGEPAAALRTYPAPLPVLPLDRIWILPAEHPRRAEALRPPLSRVASDHLPVVADVSFREPAGPAERQEQPFTAEHAESAENNGRNHRSTADAAEKKNTGIRSGESICLCRDAFSKYISTD